MKIKRNHMSKRLFNKIKGKVMYAIADEQNGEAHFVLFQKGIIDNEGIKVKFCYGTIVKDSERVSGVAMLISSNTQKIPSHLLGKGSGEYLIPARFEDVLIAIENNELNFSVTFIDNLTVMSDGSIVAHLE